ncbi:hypothetical protein SAMN04487996_10167 [Dyadobacter soli]|uniref:DUF4249 family protein n=2 Tax=Dyadobacter soli TaxID=659014 RepID=A0A1G6UVM3_9BACT|nr:hypothetical protein SAMN04487996_10167 [Dyadobacter soli]
MKTLTLIKVVSLSSVLMMAMAFSCQDHQVPEPVSNCDRVDGTPRAFPCEFEITKLEFLRKNTSQVVKTVLPGSPDVQLSSRDALRFNYGSSREYAIADFRVRVHVKRIAAASFLPVGGYEITYYQLSDPVPPFPAAYDDIFDPSLWSAPPSSPSNPITNLDMLVGETRTVETELNMVFDFMGGPQVFGEIVIGIVNNSTTHTLVAAPYKYDRLRDVHEARIPFKPSVYGEM